MPDEKPRIFAEIEQSAAYHSPSTYQEALSFYDGLSLETDPLSAQFIPLSQPGNSTVFSASGQNPKIFAVGIIPPSAVVTGNILDRSATIAGEIESEAGGENAVAAEGLGEVSTEKQTFADLQKDPQFWVDYVSMCERLGVEPRELAKVIAKESTWNPSAKNGHAKGLTQLTRSIAKSQSGVSHDDFTNFECISGSAQLPAIEKYLSKAGVRGRKATFIYARNAGGYQLPGYGRGYMSELFFLALSPEKQERIRVAVKNQHAKGVEGMFKEYNGNKFADVVGNRALDPPGDGLFNAFDIAARVKGALPSRYARLIDAAEEHIANGALPSELSNPGGDNNFVPEPPAEKFATEGSEAAKRAAKELQRLTELAATGLNSTDAGKKLLAAQQAHIKQTQDALNKMRKTPPLRLLVNPKSFSLAGTKIVNDGNWGRNGPIIEHWGDGQDVISCSGSIAGFFALAKFNANGPGLTRTARNYTAAWHNFYSLYLLYRNNAGLFLEDSFGKATNSVNLSMLGSIYIYYDNIIYVGSFNSFTITEDATRPFTADYSFEFTVRAAFLLDRTDDLFLTAGIGDPRERGRGQISASAPVLGQPPTIPFGGSPPPESNTLSPPAGPPPGGQQLFTLGGG